MTVIVALNYLTDLYIIADTRISFPDKKYDGNNVLAKIIALGPNNDIMLGFCGLVSGIKEILEGNSKTVGIFHKLENYKWGKPNPDISHFTNRLKTWFEEITTSIDETKVKNIQFIVCTIDRNHQERIKDHTGKVVGFQSFYSNPIFVYTILGSGKVNVINGNMMTVIGSGRKFQQDVLDQAWLSFKGARGNIALHDFRLWMNLDHISSIFEFNNFYSVGGPYLGIRLSANFPPQVWYFHSEHDLSRQKKQNFMTVLKDKTSNTVFNIYSIQHPQINKIFLPNHKGGASEAEINAIC